MDIKSKILNRSSFGIRGLARIFKAMDENGNRRLETDDFRWGLMDYGVSVTKEEAGEVVNHFDKNGDGRVDFDEFLTTLRVSKSKFVIYNMFHSNLGRAQSNKN